MSPSWTAAASPSPESGERAERYEGLEPVVRGGKKPAHLHASTSERRTSFIGLASNGTDLEPHTPDRSTTETTGRPVRGAESSRAPPKCGHGRAVRIAQIQAALQAE